MRKINAVLFSIILCLCLASCRELTSSDFSSTASDLSSVAYNLIDISGEAISEPQTENQSNENGESPSSVVPCNHSYSVTKVTSDCTNNGYTLYTCSKCNATYTQPAVATGHDYKYTETAATCTADGSRIGVCQKCGFQTNKEILPAMGHSFSGVTCTNCGIKDTDAARNMLYNWFEKNSEYDEQEYGQRYHLPSNTNYSLWASGTNSVFSYLSDDFYINLQIYGFEKNKCYITFKQNGQILEGEFPMDSLHSSDRNFFNVMNCTASDAEKQQMISTLRAEIDGFLLKFENEVLKPQVNITLKDLGFTLY